MLSWWDAGWMGCPPCRLALIGLSCGWMAHAARRTPHACRKGSEIGVKFLDQMGDDGAHPPLVIGACRLGLGKGRALTVGGCAAFGDLTGAVHFGHAFKGCRVLLDQIKKFVDQLD